MQMPALLPERLFPYRSAESPDQLIALLSQNPDDFVEFLLISFDDETWCNTFSLFTSQALRWATERSYVNQLPLKSVQLLVRGIQAHYQNLYHYLPNNLLCEFPEKKLVLNSLLLQASSPFFQNLIRTQCFEKNNKIFLLPNIPFSQFTIIKEFIYTGDVKELWRLKDPEIIEIFKLAHAFELTGLEEECELLLLRYIDPFNLFPFLSFADKYRLNHIKKRCYELLNEQYSGILFSPKGANDLTCELTTVTEATLEQFTKVSLYITHFIAFNEVMDSSAFITLLKNCPRLYSIDLGRTNFFSERMLQLPRFKELILGGCSWLSDIYLKRFFAVYSQLERLDVTGCSQITPTGWGEMTKLPKLAVLSLARCDKLTDQELELILISARKLRELSLAECRTLTDAGFHALATASQQFVVLDLNRTGILDRNLLEIITRIGSIRSLNISRCQNLTEQGIVDALKFSSNISEVNLEHANMSDSAIEELKKLKPFLKIDT